MFKMIFLPLNIRDYAFDTQGMKAEHCGCYVNLLVNAWGSGGYLPDDDNQLAALARVSKARWLKTIKPVMLRLFTIDERGWHRKEMTAELQKVHEKMQKNRELGAQGGRALSLKNNELRVANAIATLNLKPDSKEKEETKEEYTNYNLQPIGTYSDLEAEESTRARESEGDVEAGLLQKVSAPNAGLTLKPSKQYTMKQLAAMDLAEKRYRESAGLPAQNAPSSTMLMKGYGT